MNNAPYLSDSLFLRLENVIIRIGAIAALVFQGEIREDGFDTRELSIWVDASEEPFIFHGPVSQKAWNYIEQAVGRGLWFMGNL